MKELRQSLAMTLKRPTKSNDPEILKAMVDKKSLEIRNYEKKINNLQAMIDKLSVPQPVC